MLKDEFAKGIDRIGKNNNGLIVEKKENVLVEDKSFEEVMAYIMELGKKAQEQNKFDDANTILSQELGCDDDGNQRGLDKATPQMMGALNTIVVRLEQLLG